MENQDANCIMDKIDVNTSIEDRIRILSSEMITRGLETEESLKRISYYEKKRHIYRCILE